MRLKSNSEIELQTNGKYRLDFENFSLTFIFDNKRRLHLLSAAQPSLARQLFSGTKVKRDRGKDREVCVQSEKK